MTTPPVTTITDELLAEIEAAATESLEGCRVWFDLDSYAVKALDECDVHHVIAASPANVHAIIAELRTLRAESAVLTAENAALSTDAGRYRWLRSADDWPDLGMGANSCDAAIDAAMQESSQ